MANDLETSTGTNTANVPSTYVQKEVARRSELEKGGYYKNVVSPEQYLKDLANTSQAKGEDLELDEEKTQPSQEGAELQSDSKKSNSPLKHWNSSIKRQFEACSEGQKKAWLDSFKIIEKGYTKKVKTLQDELNLAAPVVDFLIKHEASFAKLLNTKNLTPLDYLDNLINFDVKMGNDPVYEIARLISYHNVRYEDLSNVMALAESNMKTEHAVNQQIAPLKSELDYLKKSLGLGNLALDQQSTVDNAVAAGVSPDEAKEAQDIADKVEAFFGQKDSSGKLMYPKALDNIDEILAQVQATGIGLDAAYQKVVNGIEPQEKEAESDIDYDEPTPSKKSYATARDQERAFLQSKMRQVISQYK